MPPPATPGNSVPTLDGSIELTPKAGAFAKDARQLEFEKDWALADMGIQAGELIEYWAEANDHKPQTAKSPDFQLRVVSPEELRRQLDTERLKLLERLKELIRDEERSKKTVDALAKHLGYGNEYKATERGQTAEAGAGQEDVRRRTEDLEQTCESLIARYRMNALDVPEDTERLRLIADTLRTEHKEKMPDASRLIASVGQAASDDARKEGLRSASAKQAEIIADLNALLDQMKKWSETEDLLRRTRELLLKQKSATRLTSALKESIGAKRPAEASVRTERAGQGRRARPARLFERHEDAAGADDAGTAPRGQDRSVRRQEHRRRDQACPEHRRHARISRTLPPAPIPSRPSKTRCARR